MRGMKKTEFSTCVYIYIYRQIYMHYDYETLFDSLDLTRVAIWELMNLLRFSQKMKRTN